MKVKEVINKVIPARSNCGIFVQDGLFGDLIELTNDNITNLSPDFAMDMAVHSITINDNVFTLHCDFSKKK